MVSNKVSHVMRKPAFCICDNKGADQLHGIRTADQRLCFCYIESTIPLLPRSELSSLSHLLWLHSPVCVGPGQETPKTSFSGDMAQMRNQDRLYEFFGNSMSRTALRIVFQCFGDYFVDFVFYFLSFIVRKPVFWVWDQVLQCRPRCFRDMKICLSNHGFLYKVGS